MNEGLDLSNIETTTQEEINTNLASIWRYRGPLSEMAASSLMLDYAPDFQKLHRWGSTIYGRPDPANIVALAIQNLHSYIMIGWPGGILNTFHVLRRWGMPKAQIMELVMFTQLYAGMRGLNHVFDAVGTMLAVFGDPPGPVIYPEGWAPDPAALKCGLDLTTRELTAQDRTNLTEWYERTIGYVPNSVQFGLKHHPAFVKVHRGKWEASIKTLPKQVIPYMLLRHHTITGSREGLREAALLAKSWGITQDWIVKGITGSAFYFTGMEGLYAAHDVVDEILEGMTDQA